MRHGEATLRFLLNPIEGLLADPSITEIVINRPCQVGFEAGGNFNWLDVPEFAFDRLDAIALLAGRMTHREADPAHPLCNTTLPDGQRIFICRPPATLEAHIAMCIRKPPKTARRMDDDDMDGLLALVNQGPPRRSAADQKLLTLYRAGEWKALLQEAVRCRKTIGACGVTGSGKSDFTRRLLGDVPESDRIVTVESDPEFGPVGPVNRVNLFYNDDRDGQRAIDVVRAALRMYPKTIAFQEVRGAESYALLRAILSGHNSFTTWHSAEGEEIAAMCMMLRQHESCHTAPPAYLEAMVRQCFDIIVSCSRDPGDEFRIRKMWFKAAEEGNP
jgi:type IV secretion system protein VirB11